MSSLLWEHKFNDNFHTITEMYYIWQRNALTGGTVIDGPPHPFFPGVGPGKLIPGLSDSLGFVNYTAYKLSDKDRLVLRNDILADFQGQRLGFKTTYFEHTLGYRPLLLRPGWSSAPRSASTTPRRQGDRQRHEARACSPSRRT